MSVSLSNIVSVDVQVSSTSTITSDFNLGLIVGKTLKPATSTVTVFNYSNYTSALATAGYASTDPEYKAVSMYFSQNPKSARVAVGQVAFNNDNSADYDDLDDAISAMREVNNQFYGICLACTATDSELQAVAAAVEGFSTPAIFFYETSDANTLVDGATTIFSTLKGLNYMRSFGFYNSALATAMMTPAVLGLVSGLNSLDVASAYSLAYKTLVGVTAENLSDDDFEILKAINGNAYVKFGRTYSFLYSGISAANYHLDEVLLVDVAKYLIQQHVVTGLVAQRKVPQTESGLTTILGFVAQACNSIANMGFIAGGIWRGAQVASLKSGDAVQNGFYIASGTMADQSAADRAARVTPPIYVALLSSGAIEHVVINVFITR